MALGSRLVYAFVSLYRVTLGLWLGGRCRFVPSCSAYALDALAARPLAPAVRLVVRRLVRCHPWHPGGLDPVPPPFCSARPLLPPEATVFHE